MLNVYEKRNMFNHMLDLFNGKTIREVANLSGMSKSTIHYYLHKPEFKFYCIEHCNYNYDEVEAIIKLNMQAHINIGRILGGKHSRK